ncbi:ArsA-related P-loop ATPase [Streptomyces sp. NPDC048484]|uniref:ArsA family ATPase n=1 Tax=Streptomyces sp. NPDC048484 TaxID=3155146 RepID=UPI00341C9611
MRTILITGPGGSGRTTVAAATALEAARRGTRTLVLSADLTDTLGAALGAPTGGTPTETAPGLTAWRPDAGEGFRVGLLAFQEQVSTALDLLGSARLDADELTPLPGAEELALLRALRDAAAADTFDLLVVDLPPAPQALALLALPEQLRRYLRRLLPAERQAARALRPVLGRLAGVPMPTDRLYETAARWDVELAAVQLAVEDPATTVRLVAEPGPAGADAVRSATTGLALRGLRTDALLANRVLPDASPDTWLAALAVQQRKSVDEWRAEWGQTYGVHEVPHLGRDPRGAEDLAALPVPAPVPASVPTSGPVPASGRVPGDDAPGPVEWPVVDRLADDGVLVWHIPLPGAIREELDLVRRGDELVVTAGQFRRIVTLPSALRRCAVDGASLREGELRVRFVPDPDLWPRTR